MAKVTQKYFAKTLMALIPRIFSPANLSPSTVFEMWDMKTVLFGLLMTYLITEMIRNSI